MRQLKFIKYLNIALLFSIVFIGNQCFFVNSTIAQERIPFKTKYNALHNFEQKLALYISTLSDEEREFGVLISVFDEPIDRDVAVLDSIIDQGYHILQSYQKGYEQIYLSLGKAYYYHKDYYTAIAILEDALGLDLSVRQVQEVYYWLSRSYNRISDLTKSEDMIDSLTKYGRKSNYLISELASLTANNQIAEGRYDYAIESIEMSLAGKVSKSQKYRQQFLLAQLLESQDRDDEAQVFYRKLLESDVSERLFVESKLQFAKILSKTSKDKALKSLKELTRETSSDKYNIPVFLALGDLFFQQKSFDVFVKYYQSVLADALLTNELKLKVYPKLLDAYNILEDSVHYKELYPQYTNLKKEMDQSKITPQMVSTDDHSLFRIYQNEFGKTRFTSPWPDAKLNLEISKYGTAIATDEIEGITKLPVQVTVQEEADRLYDFPTNDSYNFVLRINNLTTNVNPLRYLIGQSNRTQFQELGLKHSLSVVNNENQLIVVGTFNSLEEVKRYENRMLSLLPEEIKGATKKYSIFVLPTTLISRLKDATEIENYYNWYLKNKKLLHK